MVPSVSAQRKALKGLRLGSWSIIVFGALGLNVEGALAPMGGGLCGASWEEGAGPSPRSVFGSERPDALCGMVADGRPSNAALPARMVDSWPGWTGRDRVRESGIA